MLAGCEHLVKRRSTGALVELDTTLRCAAGYGQLSRADLNQLWMTHRTLLPKPKALRRRAPAVALLALLLLLGAAIPDGLASDSATLFQQGPKLTGGEEESGAGRFGRSVALSADGNTALVGAPRDSGEVGAVWVFTRTGSTWTRQAKLTGGDEESGAGRFGRSVALSADGDTALIGAPNGGGGGAAWVFTRADSTWTQQAKLTGIDESGNGWFGQSVALSANGDTALVGGYVDHSDTGAAWVFERSGAGASATWEQQGAKLTGGGEESGEGEFGWSVALSAEGDTALIGGRKDDGDVGAAWVFTRTGSGAGASWAQQGAKLTGGGEESGVGELGQSVALSADGDTALVGGFHDDSGDGAAWVFTRTGSGAGASWAQQGAKLTGADEAGHGYFGDAVALTPDGDTALIGGVKDDEQRGAAWVFARAGTGAGASWAQQGEKLTGGEEESGKGEFGWSVAFSGDGDSALVGAIGDGKWAGAVWVFGSEAPSPEPPSPEPRPPDRRRAATPPRWARRRNLGRWFVWCHRHPQTGRGRLPGRGRRRGAARQTPANRRWARAGEAALHGHDHLPRASHADALAPGARGRTLPRGHAGEEDLLDPPRSSRNRRAPARPRRPLACARRPRVSTREPRDPCRSAGPPKAHAYAVKLVPRRAGPDIRRPSRCHLRAVKRRWVSARRGWAECFSDGGRARDAFCARPAPRAASPCGWSPTPACRCSP